MISAGIHPNTAIKTWLKHNTANTRGKATGRSFGHRVKTLQEKSLIKLPESIRRRNTRMGRVWRGHGGAAEGAWHKPAVC